MSSHMSVGTIFNVPGFSTDLCLYIAIDSHPCPPLIKKFDPGCKILFPATRVTEFSIEKQKMSLGLILQVEEQVSARSKIVKLSL